MMLQPGRVARILVMFAVAMTLSFHNATAQQTAAEPLTLKQVEDLVSLHVPDSTVRSEIRKRGLAFTSTPAVLASLRAKGAGPLTIAAIKAPPSRTSAETAVSGQTRGAEPVRAPGVHTVPSWVSIFQWGQRIFQLQADVSTPGTLYATTNRGLFRSLNSGMTWEALWVGPELTYSVFDQSRRSPDVLYLGVAIGQRGGIYKSVNSGLTWSQIGTDDIKRAVENVRVDSDSADTVYVVSDSSDGAFICTGCVLYKSLNGGRTWGNIAPNARSSDAVAGGIQFLTVDPNQSGHLFVNGHMMYSGQDRNPSNLWESTDGGLSWARRNSVVHTTNSSGYDVTACNWSSYVIKPGDPGVIVGTADGNGWGGNYPPLLFFSRDRGESWQDIKIVERAQWRETAAMQSLAWSATSPTLYAGTSESLYQSSRPGQGWQRLLPYQTTDIVSTPSGDLYAVTAAGLLKSRNSGRRWHLSGMGLPTSNGMNGCTLQTIMNDRIYVGCKGGFLTTSDSGLSWNWSGLGDDPTPGVSADILPRPHGQDVRNLLVATDGTLYLNLASEGGARVIRVQPDGKIVNIDLRGKAPNWIDASPSTPSVLYATVGEGFASWRNAMGGNSLMKSDDGGFTWRSFALARWARPKLAGSSVNLVPSFAVAAQSSDSVYAFVVLNDSRTRRLDYALERTTDGGETWRDVYSDAVMGPRVISGQAGTLSSIVIDPRNAEIVYVVFTNSVFRSPDGGRHWVELPLRNAGVRSLAVSSESSNLLYAAAQNRVWLSNDGGMSWLPSAAGFLQQTTQKVVSAGSVTLAQGENGIYRFINRDLNWLTKRWKELEDAPETNPIGLPQTMQSDTSGPERESNAAAGSTTGSQSVAGGPVYHIGNGVSAPSPTYKPDPDYTPQAKNAKLQGNVTLYVEIDSFGHPQNIKVLRGLGLGLDEKAVEAVRKWRFRPAYKDGNPVTVSAQIEVHFRLL